MLCKVDDKHEIAVHLFRFICLACLDVHMQVIRDDNRRSFHLAHAFNILPGQSREFVLSIATMVNAEISW